VVEAKRWNRSLDRADADQKAEDGVPSTQMLRYLRRVDDVTNGGLRWGMLTNGRHWRLYFRGALSIAEDFLEIDIGKVLDLPGCERDLLDKRPDVFPNDDAWQRHFFKLFAVIFGRNAFVPGHRTETFHQLALRQGKQWEARVARDLSDTVFRRVFPELCRALAAADGKAGSALDAAYLDELREGALILLYRLLFVLYAEDRNLLPDEIGPYADYSLTRLRLEGKGRPAFGSHENLLVSPRRHFPGDRSGRQRPRHSAVQRWAIRSLSGADPCPRPATRQRSRGNHFPHVSSGPR
jgi:hypothetical protein